jgi:hypothetical protein
VQRRVHLVVASVEPFQPTKRHRLKPAPKLAFRYL